jgi:predicted phosphodiesterase
MAALRWNDHGVSTAIVSDLHLGSGNDEDLLRHGPMRRRLFERLAGVDRVVLLGDVIELRDRPLAETMEIAISFFAELGDAMDGRELVLVPGNHDHHLLEPWLERRRLDGVTPLGLEEWLEPDEGAVAALASAAAPATLRLAYPGLWLRPGIYATHGHYLDRHLTVPTFERLGVAAIERVLGTAPDGPDPLEPPEDRVRITPDEYERAQAPVYALLYALAQAGTRVDAASPSARIWAALGGGESRASRLRGWLLGAVALPGAIGVANRLGLGPVRSDLSVAAIARAGAVAMGEVVQRLEIEAEYVIFGHTHRRGPLAAEGEWRAGEAVLLNSGSWVHAPGLLGPEARSSPYWPGTIGLLEDQGPPRLEHLLDGFSREELAEAARG